MKKINLIKGSLLLSITLFGCLPATISNLSMNNSFSNSPKENVYEKWMNGFQKEAKSKIPYNGDIDIKLKIASENKTFSILSSSTPSIDLNTIPSSKIVYKKEFILNKKELDIKENIIINDTSKRYLLYIKKESVKNEIEKINININTFDWVKNYDFIRKVD